MSPVRRGSAVSLLNRLISLSYRRTSALAIWTDPAGSVRIRRAGEEDARAISIYLAGSVGRTVDGFADSVESAIRKGDFCVCLAMFGNWIVGYCSISRAGVDGWCLGNVRVHEALRRRGIGEGLVRHALDDARKAERTPVFVNIDHDNVPSLSLFRKVGFRPAANEDAARKIEEHRRRSKGTSKRQIVMLIDPD